MDFGRLSIGDVLDWLHSHSQWPAAMPVTMARARLGLSETEIAEARRRLAEGREQRRLQTTFIPYGNRTYSDDPVDMRALVDAVRDGVPAALLDTPVRPSPLLPVPPGNSERRRRDDGAPRAWRAAGAPLEKTKAIGLAGEVVVGEWLRHQFGVSPEDTWVSGYRRDVLADGKGDDALGYDFKVVTPDRTWLFEVKATTDEEQQFAFSESEVQRAGDLAPNEEYIVVFVTNVLDPERRRVHPLPNPLGPGGLRYYRVVGRALRLLFDLG